MQHDTTAAILAPLGVELFLAEHFDRKSALVRAPEPTRFASWFGYERLNAVAWGALGAAKDAPPMRPLPCWAVTGQDSIPVDPRTAQDFFRQGMTVVVNAVDGNDAFLRTVLDTLATDLGFVGQTMVNCYLSPEGSGAFGQHFDDHHVIILQIDGKKAWRYGATSSAPNPRFAGSKRSLVDVPDLAAVTRATFGAALDVPETSALDEAILGPGDVLYLPPGTWHATSAVGGASLALTITLVPYRACDAILTAVLGRILREDAWFADLAPVGPRGLAEDPRVEARIGEALTKLRGAVESLDPATVLREVRRVASLPPPLLHEVLATCAFRAPPEGKP